MAGFGKNNARSNDLRKLMIHGAAEVFEKEIALRREATCEEIVAIVNDVCKAREMTVSDIERSSVIAGTKRLATNRRFIEEIVAKWSDGRAALGYEDIKRAGEILGNTTVDGRDPQFRPLGA